MKSVLKYCSLALIIIGVALFVVLHKLGITSFNQLSAIPFLMTIAGAILFIWMTKKESRY